MKTNIGVDLDAPHGESFSPDAMSIAIVGPDEKLRKAVATALAGCHRGEIRQFASYPPSLDELPKLIQQHFDIILIEWDSNQEYALDLVEAIGTGGSSTVMVYSNEKEPDRANPEMLMRCMRAGAREFLSMPFAQDSIAAALVRTAARHMPVRAAKRSGGRLLLFCGSKGGAGVTAIACNFAVAIAQESGESTLLIDLDLPLGDAALNLGITPGYSTIDALQNFGRLDASFLSKLLVKHSSGLFVLAAPGNYSVYQSSNDAILKLLTVARQEFQNVVVDVGSKLDITGVTAPFKDADTIYLVTQSGIPELRNANRLIQQNADAEGPNLEVVLNRYVSRGMRVSDDDIKKALTKPARWKIPNDYAAMSQMHDTAMPVTSTDSLIGRQFAQMARSVCGLAEIPEEKKRGFFSFKRSAAPKRAPSEDYSSGRGELTQGRSGAARLTSLNLTPETGLEARELKEPGDSEGVDPIEFVDVRRDSGDEPKADQQDEVWGLSTDEEETASQLEEPQPVPAPDAHVDATPEADDPETRVYNGDLYLRGEDGNWIYQGPAVVEPEPEEEKAVLQWATPDPIPSGTPLSDKQLNATASVPGTFVYIPASGYVLAGGTHTLWVTFIPTVGGANAVVQSCVTLVVEKEEQPVSWTTPASSLIWAQAAKGMAEPKETGIGSVDESLIGDVDVRVSGAGVQSLDLAAPEISSFTRPVTDASVMSALETPAIAWPNPPAVFFGTRLDSAQLNATSSVAGSFQYSPGEGEVLAAGRHRLTARFIPADPSRYASVDAEVSLLVAAVPAVVNWPSPAAIPYGTHLGIAQLNATASVPGSFHYSPGEGDVLPAGRHRLSVSFTPADAANYISAQAEVSLVVTSIPAEIQWPSPAAIPFGTALSAAQLNATASVPGTFIYTPGECDVLPAGRHMLQVAFNPSDATNYTSAQAEVPLVVTSILSTITWNNPVAIPYGTPLGISQLNALANAPGTFQYTPEEGTVLPVGRHTLKAVFTPHDSSNQMATKAEVTLTVIKQRPTITWPAPAPIVCGAALSARELNATASVPGTFVYIPGAGAVLSAGKHTPTVVFTPEDTANYTTTQTAVSLNVLKATPVIDWPTPGELPYGSVLTSAELNATASVPGVFTYHPDIGDRPGEGVQVLTAVFTPADTANYKTVEASVTITVTPAAPIDIAWLAPAAIAFGTPLSTLQLNATASIPGAFLYSPREGEVLNAGDHTLSVMFSPSDSRFPTSHHWVELTVFKAKPEIIWQTPEAIMFGTALDSTQLNARASVPGKYTYIPAAGERPLVGRQKLSVLFTPKDNKNFAPGRADVFLEVTKAIPTVEWPNPGPISYGTPLGATQLNALASVPGRFVYAPAAGTVLTPGVQLLSVTFFPDDAANVAMAKTTATLVVHELPNVGFAMPQNFQADVYDSFQAPRTNPASFVARRRWIEEAGEDPEGNIIVAESREVRPPIIHKPVTEHVKKPPEPLEAAEGASIEEEPETRTYKGVTYIKGPDGQWHRLPS
jgi:Flp pilus assembly CpaE family ATPase